ncbi:hypothetical protein LLH23_20265 [bacterium]|nr:hypothetical protein [bacterium]
MTSEPFSGRQVATDELLAELTEVRVRRADELRAHAAARQRRPDLAPDGRLVILAADHPARLVTGSHGDPLALANRQEYLGRILRVLQAGHVDGLMATPDIIEEVLAVDLLLAEGRGEAAWGRVSSRAQSGREDTPAHAGVGLLDGKLLIGCMNRGGLAGTAFEMWDALTAYDARGLREMHLDGAKLMFRLDPTSRGSGQTLVWCAQAINACLEEDLAIFLEPLPVREQNGRFVVQKEAGELARICGVASALGRSSLRTWLKLPYCPDYGVVARATTCPILMLGGEAGDQPVALLEDLARGLGAGPNVRGALIGRNVLYPGAHDPAVMARAIWLLVHERMPARLAWEQAHSE